MTLLPYDHTQISRINRALAYTNAPAIRAELVIEKLRMGGYAARQPVLPPCDTEY